MIITELARIMLALVKLFWLGELPTFMLLCKTTFKGKTFSIGEKAEGKNLYQSRHMRHEGNKKEIREDRNIAR